MSDAVRWARVKRLFDEALERPPQNRAAFLHDACGGDAELEADVASLLDAHARAGAFAEAPAALALDGVLDGDPATRDARALKPGDRIGPYEIVEFVAAGGMGEVYRAFDAALARDAAIKVISSTLAASGNEARFEREARALAALNHPNIASIYSIEDAVSGDGTRRRAIAMELVDGETLADRIARAAGPAVAAPGSAARYRRGRSAARLSLDEVLGIVRQLVDALDAAHEKGIVHRDLKPTNIKITPEGTVKVLDLGLAKMETTASVADSAAGFVAGVAPMAAGIVSTMAPLGTLAYMSPEQLGGGPIDKRTDIWAFGCVLYEMLTGRAPFGRDSSPATVTSILDAEPDWTVLPAAVPPSIRALLGQCLQKKLARRLRDIGDARFLIDQAAAATSPAPLRQAQPGRERLAWLIALLALAAVVWTAFIERGSSGTVAREMRLQIPTPPGFFATSFAISPDGEHVAYSANVDGQMRLWLRPLASESAHVLAGTEEAVWPFWSPDSRAIGFFTLQGLQLKRVDLATGLVRTIVSAPDPRGGSWNTDGTILFSLSAGPLYRVHADGGQTVEVTQLREGQANHRWPHFLPDGRRFLFTATGTAGGSGVFLGTLGSPDVQRLSDATSAAGFLPSDLVMFARHGSLWAQRLDMERRALVEEPTLVAARVVGTSAITGSIAAASSLSGRIAYRAAAEARQLAWIDRSGRQISTLGDVDLSLPEDHRLSRDGRTVVLQRTVDGNTDLWLIDSERGVSRRVTYDPGIEYEAALSADGSQAAYASDQTGQNDVYRVSLGGESGPVPLISSAGQENVYDWSRDGRFLLYGNQGPNDLWILPLAGGRRPFAILQTPFNERYARFSPDGRWVTYQSDESGRFEIYVRPFPGPGSAWRVSPAGGTNPEWRGDGRELFYVSADNRLMAVPLDGGSVAAGAPVALFTLPQVSLRCPYAASPDGQRFLINRIVSDPAPITVLFNWSPAQRQ